MGGALRCASCPVSLQKSFLSHGYRRLKYLKMSLAASLHAVLFTSQGTTRSYQTVGLQPQLTRMGRRDPPMDQVAEASWSTACWDLAGFSFSWPEIRGAPVLLLVRDRWGLLVFSSGWGGEGAATLAFSHERWHGVKGHKSILKLAPLKNPNTIKRHIPEPKNKHKTRHFLRHEGPSQEHCGLQVPR